MSIYEPFQGSNSLELDNAEQLWLVFFEGKIVLPASGYFWHKQDWFIQDEAFIPGLLDGNPIAVLFATHIPEGLELMSPRAFLALENPGYTYLYSHSTQLMAARKTHRFCGACGSECQPRAGEWAMACSNCSMVYYPRISPCIIVLVHRGDEFLLVQHQRHLRHSPVYTTIAGFIEPGESAEEAVVREVKEETGIRIKNIRYHFSQSWPFPHSLMLGFHAEYESGEITLEEKELTDGQWFHKDQLPDLPPGFTIARKLIDLAAQQRD